METGVKKLTISNLGIKKSIPDFYTKKRLFLHEKRLHLCVCIASGFGLLAGDFFLTISARHFAFGVRQKLSKKNRAAPYQRRMKTCRTYRRKRNRK